MLKPATLYLALVGLAAGAGFPLGVNYSIGVPGSGAITVGTDGADSVYLLQNEAVGVLKPTVILGAAATNTSSYLTKLSPDGSSTVYVTQLGFTATAMAVDPAGYVYVLADSLVEKLDVSGARVVYQSPIKCNCGLAGLAVDSSGHIFVTGVTWSSIANIPASFHPQRPLPAGFVVKLNNDGAGFDYFTYLIDANIDFPSAIAVSPSGDAYIAGVRYSPLIGGFLALLSADASTLVYSVPIIFSEATALAVTSDGSAVVYQQGTDMGPYTATVRRFNPQGTVEFSRGLPGSFWESGALAVDAGGNTYVTGFTTSANFPLKDNLGQCRSYSNFLTVLDPSGNLIQSTYVPGQVPISNPSYLPFGGVDALALGSGTVYLTGVADGGNGGSLVRLSPSAQSQTVRLGCLANAAFNLAGPVTAGEIVSLFGESLSPAQPASGGTSVSVTFDGMPAPLLYTSASQVNAIVPWELEGAATTQVCESYDGASATCMTLKVVPAAPGVFMADSGYALALNQDGTINSASNPAPPGSIVSIFSTGLGPVTPLPQDGVIAKPPVGRNLFGVGIIMATGGAGDARFIDIKPQYAGPAPFQVYGLSQVNLPAIQGYMYLQVESPRRNGSTALKSVIGSPVPVVVPGSSQAFGIHVAAQ